MSTTGTTPTDTSTVPTVDARPRGTTWRDVLKGAAIGQLLMAAFMIIITAVFESSFSPVPVVVGLIVTGGIALLSKRPGRGGVVYAGIVSLLLVLVVLAFGGLTVLSRTESTFELIQVGGLLAVSLLGLVATVGAFRGKAGAAAEVAPKVAGAFIALLVVVGVVAGALTGSATRMPGDVALKAEGFEFSADRLEADAGRVAVFVQNEDVAHHDFTIKDVVAVDLPGQKAGRGVFDLEAGTYRFYCSLHPDMEGELQVS